jgi:uncharacterized repeat protein (TIGR02543 family)
MKSSRAVRIGVVLLALIGLTLQPNTVMLDGAFAVTSYKITFKANGGTGSMATQSVPTTGRALTANKFKRTGYVFSGWALTSAGSVKYKDRGFIKPRANTTLYAKWVVAISKPTLLNHTLGALLWNDEFGGPLGSQVSSANWTARYCGHDASNGGGTCHNAEPQWYAPWAIGLDGTSQGNAVITTTRVSGPPTNAGDCLTSQCFYTSGRFDTQGKVSFMYGYIEARMKMPVGGANWPAFWAIGDNITDVGWPLSGEIDIAEQGGNLPMRNSSAVHYSTVNQAICCGNHLYEVKDVVNVANYQTDFHTYGMAWSPNRMEFYVDRVLFWVVTPQTLRTNVWSFNAPFFLIFNNATGPFGGNYDGWLESKTYIDYVRVWQLDGVGEVMRH